MIKDKSILDKIKDYKKKDDIDKEGTMLNESLIREYKNKLSQKKLESLNLFYLMQIKNRTANIVKKLINCLKKSDTQRNEQELDFLLNYTLQFNYVRYLYNEYKYLSPNFHKTLCQYMRYETYKKGQTIYMKGESSDKIFLIIEGSVNQMTMKSKAEIEKERKELTEQMESYDENMNTTLQKNRLKRQSLCII